MVTDESFETAVNLVKETKNWLYIHYIYSHTTNFNEFQVQTGETAARETKRGVGLLHVA